MNSPKVHTVCVVGATADVTSRITHLLEDQRVKLFSRWRAGEHASADLLIIDADSLYGHMDWLKANSSGRLVAAFTHTPETHNAEFSLPHGFVATDVVALLNRVGQQLDGPSKPTTQASANVVPAAAPVRPEQISTSPAAVTPVASLRTPPTLEAVAQPAAQPAAAVRPAASSPAPVEIQAPPVKPRGIQLLDLLEQDSPLKGRLRLSAEGLPTILLDPTERTWFSTSGLKGLSGWAMRQLSADDVHHADEKAFITEIGTVQGHPYARLQWLAHLVRDEGQLNASLDANARYKLSRWPQSEREFPRHFRIATVMLKQSGTPGEIADLAGATPGDVANFINAYHALGYIEQESTERVVESSTRGGLFGRMRRASANIS